VLATEAELESAPDEFLNLLEESRAVGLVFLGDELSRRVLLVAFGIEVRLTGVHARQPCS